MAPLTYFIMFSNIMRNVIYKELYNYGMLGMSRDQKYIHVHSNPQMLKRECLHTKGANIDSTVCHVTGNIHCLIIDSRNQGIGNAIT